LPVGECVLARGSSDGNIQLQPDNGGACPSVMGMVSGKGGYNLRLELDFNLCDFTFVFVIFGFLLFIFTHFGTIPPLIFGLPTTILFCVQFF
jgi:hypothetical protein